MNAFRTRLIALLCAGLLFALSNVASAADPLPAPFLTRAELKEVTINGKKEKRWMPTTDKIAFGWSDQPFAVHIPFDLKMKTVMGRPGAGPDGAPPQPFKANATRIQWHIRGFAAPAIDDSESNPSTVSSGLYRLDGQPPSISSPEPQAYLGTPWPPNLDRKSRPNDPPANVSLNFASPTGEGRYAYWVVLDPTRVSVKHWQKYDECAGSIHATIIEDALPNQAEKKVEKHIQVAVRQNSWQVESVKESLLGDWKKEIGKGWTALDMKTNWKDGVLSSIHRISSVTDTTEVAVEWKLPSLIRDHRVAASGVEVRQTAGGKYPQDSRYGLSEPSVRLWTIPYTDDVKAAPRTGPTGPLFGFEKTAAWFWTFNPGNTLYDWTSSKDKTTGLHKHTWPIELGGGRTYAPKHNTAPPELMADRPAGVHRLYAMDVCFDSAARPRPADTPVKRIEVFARRTSDLVDNRTTKLLSEPTRPTTDPDDGYWDWLDGFDDLIATNYGRLEVIHKELQLLASERREKRKKWVNLLRLDLLSFPADRPLERDAIEQFAVWVARGATRGRAIPLAPTVTKPILDEMKAERERLKVEMEAIRQRQQKLIEEGLRLVKVVSESVEVQIIASRGVTPRPHLPQWAEYYKDRVAIAKLSMYDAARWYGPDEMQQVIDEFKFADSDVKEWSEFVKAKAALGRAEYLEENLQLLYAMPNPPGPNSPQEQAALKERIVAMAALREVVRINPEHPGAREVLLKLELAYLDVIARKLDEERKLTLAGFKQYLTNRGLAPEVLRTPMKDGDKPQSFDPTNLKDAGNAIGNMWDGPLEVLGSIWGDGISLIGNGLPIWKNDDSLINALEGEAAKVQDELAQHYVSVMLIQKLVRGGMPLEKVRNLRPEELEKYVNARTVGGKPLDPKKARRLCQDVHETFGRLGDLRALAEGKPDEFARFLNDSYYTALDPSKSGAEFWGDFFFSPGNMLLWHLGGAMTRGGTSWKFMSGKQIELLEKAGEIERVQQVFARGMRLESLANQMAKSDTGKAILAKFAEDMAFYESTRVGAAWTGWTKEGVRRWTANNATLFFNGGARLAAGVVVYGAAAYAVHDIPGLRQLVDVLAAMGPFEATYDVLARRGLQLKQLEASLAHLDPVLGSAGKELEEIRNASARIEAIKVQLKATSSRPNEVAIKELDDIIARSSKKAGTQPMGNNPLADLHSTVSMAAAAVKSGNASEAGRALKSLTARRKKLEEMLKNFEAKLALARKVVGMNPPSFTPTAYPEPLVGAQAPKPLIPKELPPAGMHAEFVEYGDLALLQGKLHTATEFYTAARIEKLKNKLPDPADIVEQRLSLAIRASQESSKIARMKAKNINLGADLPIEEPEVQKEIIARLANNQVTFEQFHGGANPIFAVKDVKTGKTLFIFKQLKDADKLAAEVLSGAIVRGLGIKTPGSRALKLPHQIKVKRPNEIRPSDREVDEAIEGILYRVLEGKEVHTMTEAQLLALKSDLALQRPIRHWIGDTDGHLRNVQLGSDGHLWMLDFDCAMLRKGGFHLQVNPWLILNIKVPPGTPYPALTQDDMMRAFLASPKWMEDYLKGLNKGTALSGTGGELYGWIDQLDGAISYEEVAPIIGAIEDFAVKGGGKRLRKALEQSGLPPDQVQEAFEVLVERANLLKKALEGKYKSAKNPEGANLLRPAGSRLLLSLEPEFAVAV